MSKLLDDAYGSKFFGPADIEEDYGVRVPYLIAGIDWQEMRDFKTNAPKMMLVLESPDRKPWIVKDVHAKALIQALGRDEDSWPGATVSVYKATVPVSGVEYDALRVDPNRTKHLPKRKAAPKKPDDGTIDGLPNEEWAEGRE